MRIKLLVLQSPPESGMDGSAVIFDPTGGTVGRGAKSTFVLTDPNRFVSSTHLKVVFADGGFQIIDQSTNGTSINTLSNSLVKGQPYNVKDGDMVLLGPFALKVEILQSAEATPVSPAPLDKSDDLLDDSIFSGQAAPIEPPAPVSDGVPQDNLFDDLDKWLEPQKDEAPAQDSLMPGGVDLGQPIDKDLHTPELDPLALLGGSDKPGGDFADLGLSADTPSKQQHKVYPGEELMGGSLGQGRMDLPDNLADDWKQPESAPMQNIPLPENKPAPNFNTEKEQSAPASDLGLSSQVMPGSLMDLVNTPSEELVARRESEADTPVPADIDPMADDTYFGTNQPVEAEQAQITPVVPKPRAEPEIQPRQETKPQPEIQPKAVPKPKVAVDARPEAAASSSQSISPQAGDLASMLGLQNLSPEKQAQLTPLIATIVRESIEGLLKALRARQAIKNEFRMNLTMIQSAENNPLKFSVSMEDAVENLFAKEGRSYLPPEEAIAEAFNDLADHQVALFKAVRTGYDQLVGEFTPEKLERKFKRRHSKSLFSGSVKNWEAYKDFYEQFQEDPEKAFKRSFGEAFAESYERNFNQLKARRPGPEQ